MAKKKEGDKDFQFVADCFTLSFMVYPTIGMIREDALKLATSLAEHTELTDIHMADESWVFQKPQARQGQPKGMIRVEVDDESEVSIKHHFPNAGLERFEYLVEKILHSIGSVVTPEAVFGHAVVLSYVVDIGGDARKNLLGSLALDRGDGDDEEGKDSKLGVFNRPCHAVGLRLAFPPYREEGRSKSLPEDAEGEDDANEQAGQFGEQSGAKETKNKGAYKGADWQATLTLQTLADEPNKVSIEVDGRWVSPMNWKQFVKSVTDRLRLVNEFLRQQTTEFLKHFRSES